LNSVNKKRRKRERQLNLEELEETVDGLKGQQEHFLGIVISELRAEGQILSQFFQKVSNISSQKLFLLGPCKCMKKKKHT
jgi:hypothetical protein